MYVLVCMNLEVISGSDAAGMVDDDDNEGAETASKAGQAARAVFFYVPC